jgi:hypothetical protein
VHKEPEPLDAPPALAAIVRKCLAKSPDARFQSATELRLALEAASTEATSPLNRRTLAIRDVSEISEDPPGFRNRDFHRTDRMTLPRTPFGGRHGRHVAGLDYPLM